MKINKTVLIAGTTAAIGLATLTGAFIANAASTGTTNPADGLVSAIAQRFNLNKSDVQQVFDQQHQQMSANRQAQTKTNLDQAVSGGKLTQDQENQILAKYQEIQAFMTSLSGKSAADRQSAMKTEMTAIQQWVKDNNIPTAYFHFGFGRGMRGHGMANWSPTNSSPTPTSS